MTSYVVIKRMQEDRLYMPGEVVVDIPRADILMHRGYLQIVPDDYAAQHEAASAETRPPSYEEAIAAGYSEEAAKSLAAGRQTKKVQAETEKINERLSRQANRTQADALATAMETTVAEIMDLSDEDYDNGVKEFLMTEDGETPQPPPIGDEPSKGTDAGPDKDMKDPNQDGEAVVDRDSIGPAGSEPNPDSKG